MNPQNTDQNNDEDQQNNAGLFNENQSAPSNVPPPETPQVQLPEPNEEGNPADPSEVPPPAEM